MEVYNKFLYFVCKETTHKSTKVAYVKTCFSNVHVIGTTCSDQCFFILDDGQKLEVIVTLELLSETIHSGLVVAFF